MVRTCGQAAGVQSADPERGRDGGGRQEQGPSGCNLAWGSLCPGMWPPAPRHLLGQLGSKACYRGAVPHKVGTPARALRQVEEVGHGFSVLILSTILMTAASNGLLVQETEQGREVWMWSLAPATAGPLFHLCRLGRRRAPLGDCRGQLQLLSPHGSHGLNRHRWSCQRVAMGLLWCPRTGLESAGQS